MVVCSSGLCRALTGCRLMLRFTQGGASLRAACPGLVYHAPLGLSPPRCRAYRNSIYIRDSATPGAKHTLRHTAPALHAALSHYTRGRATSGAKHTLRQQAAAAKAGASSRISISRLRQIQLAAEIRRKSFLSPPLPSPIKRHILRRLVAAFQCGSKCSLSTSNSSIT